MPVTETEKHGRMSRERQQTEMPDPELASDPADRQTIRLGIAVIAIVVVALVVAVLL